MYEQENTHKIQMHAHEIENPESLAQISKCTSLD